MKIGLKFQNYERDPSGINRYTKGVLDVLIPMDTDDEFISLENNYMAFPIRSILPESFLKIWLNRPVSFIDDSVEAIDLIHSYFNPIHYIRYDCPKIITIHDIIALIHPEWVSHMRDFYDREIRLSAKAADAIIADSKWTKKDIVEYYDVPEEKVFVVYGGLDSAFDFSAVNSDQAVAVTGGASYILSVCTIEPRKNLRGLIDAFVVYKQSRDKKNDIKLVLVGGLGWDADFVQFMSGLEDSIRNDIILPGYVSDDVLSALYVNALAVAYVSKYEGFGLPILEGLSAGKAVICSNTTSMPEVGGDAVEYCNPYDVESIAVAIKNVVENDARRNELEMRAITQAAKFSYKKAAEDIIKIYRKFG